MRVKTKQEFGVNLGLVGLKTVSGKLQVKSGPCHVGCVYCVLQGPDKPLIGKDKLHHLFYQIILSFDGGEYQDLGVLISVYFSLTQTYSTKNVVFTCPVFFISWQDNGWNNGTAQVIQDVLVEPIQSANLSNISNKSAISNMGNMSYHEAISSDIIGEVQRNLVQAYLILAMFLFIAVLLVLFVICGDPSKSCLKSSTQKQEEEKQEEGTRPVAASFKIPFLIGVFIFYACECVLEIGYGNLLLAYAVEGLGWSKSMGAKCTSVFFGTYVTGRALGIVIVKFLSPRVMLGGSCTLNVLSLLPLVLFSNVYPNVLWISTAAIGLSTSTIFATGISWTERYVKVSDGTSVIMLTAGSIGELLGPALFSFMYDRFGAGCFVYIMFTSASAVLVIFIILLIAATRQGERFVKNNQHEEGD